MAVSEQDKNSAVPAQRRAPIAPRPAPAVAFSERRHRPRPVVDVHGRRRDLLLAAPHPVLSEVAQWLTPAFYVDLGRPCNSACLYCAVPPHEDAQGFLPFDEVETIAQAGVATGCDRAILIGGEPTIYPRLHDVLDLLNGYGLDRHIVMSNGLRLADPGVVAGLVERGVATLHLSIDTVNPAIYDQLSRSQGRLPRQLAALARVLERPELNVYLYVAATALNLSGIGDLMGMLVDAAHVARRAPPPVILALIKPLGDALRHADQLLLDPRRAAEQVVQWVRLGDQLGVTVGHRNLQACLAPEITDRNVDYYLDDYSVEVATGRRLPYSHAENWFKLPSCATCGHHDVCHGLYRDAAQRYGDQDYRPIDRAGLAAGAGQDDAVSDPRSTIK